VGCIIIIRVKIRVNSRELAKRIPIDISRDAYLKGRYWGPNIPPWPLADRRGIRGPYKVRKPSVFGAFKKIPSVIEAGSGGWGESPGSESDAQYFFECAKAGTLHTHTHNFTPSRPIEKKKWELNLDHTKGLLQVRTRVMLQVKCADAKISLLWRWRIQKNTERGIVSNTPPGIPRIRILISPPVRFVSFHLPRVSKIVRSALVSSCSHPALPPLLPLGSGARR